MKVGDLIRHTYLRHDSQVGVPVVGTILCVGRGATSIKVLEQSGEINWFSTKDCEVISEGG